MANILNKQYQDILGINPKYRVVISSLGPRASEVFGAIVNLCADTLINYDNIKASTWHQNVFGYERNSKYEFFAIPFSANTIMTYGDVPVYGATLTKLVSLGLLIKKEKNNKIYQYCIPNDLFTTNDLSIKFYNPDIPQF